VYRRFLLVLMLLLLSPLLSAQPAPEPDPSRLPPPVERVLADLALQPAVRDQVRQTLLRQRQERQQADASLRERHRAELAALLTPDQLVALDAARPPPPGEHGPPRRPQDR
jgi:hypothetical protein